MLFYHVNTKIWSKKDFKMHISQSFFPALLSCAIWSCAMLDCFFDSFLITFYTRGSSSISQFTVANWYVVLDTPVVATGGYNVPVVATSQEDFWMLQVDATGAYSPLVATAGRFLLLEDPSQ